METINICVKTLGERDFPANNLTAYICKPFRWHIGTFWKYFFLLRHIAKIIFHDINVFPRMLQFLRI